MIFDVGASNGAWARAAAGVFPDAQYYLFVPLVDHAEAYGERMRQTLREHPNFHLHTCALGGRSGDATLNVWPNLVGSTALPLRTARPDVRQVQVPMFTLDDAVIALGLPRPQLVKMDTQGYELEILQGGPATLATVDALLLECWLCRGYGQTTPLLLEVAAWLRGRDFHLWDVGDEYRSPEGVLAALDCAFVHPRAGLTPPWYYEASPAP